MAKVVKREAVRSSGRVKSLKLAATDRTSMATEIVMPIGMEYFLILETNWSLMRAVFFSRARTRPGRPMQAKLRSDISMGA